MVAMVTAKLSLTDYHEKNEKKSQKNNITAEIN